MSAGSFVFYPRGTVFCLDSVNLFAVFQKNLSVTLTNSQYA